MSCVMCHHVSSCVIMCHHVSSCVMCHVWTAARTIRLVIVTLLCWKPSALQYMTWWCNGLRRRYWFVTTCISRRHHPTDDRRSRVRSSLSLENNHHVQRSSNKSNPTHKPRTTTNTATLQHTGDTTPANTHIITMHTSHNGSTIEHHHEHHHVHRTVHHTVHQ